MAEATVKATSGQSERDAKVIRSALHTLDAAGSGIAALSASLKDGLGRSLIAAVETIRASQGRLIVTGMGKSGHVARKLAATFASTGTPAFFVHPSEASHGDLGMIQDNDAVLALSWSGETAELKNIIDYAKRRNITLIGMTSDSNSTLGCAADVVLVLPQVREACPHNLAPTTRDGRRTCHRPSGKPRLLCAAIPRAAPGRQAGRASEIRPRRDAHR
jgi:arabinose-5-phosphate isomerase